MLARQIFVLQKHQHIKYIPIKHNIFSIKDIIYIIKHEIYTIKHKIFI